MTGPCKDCVSGTPSTETPKGEEVTIHGLPVYVAKPHQPAKGLVVFLPDAFGWTFVNNRVLADHYAEKGGHLVYLPEFMNGHSMEGSAMELTDKIMEPASWFETIFVKPILVVKLLSAFIPFLIFNRAAIVKPRIYNFFSALRTTPETANMKIGAAGFCWGGQWAVRLAHDTPSSRVHRTDTEAGQLQSLIDCAYTAHPSFLSMPNDIENVSLPLSIAIGDVDMAMKFDLVKQAQGILQKKRDVGHEVVVFPGAKHGFAIRGDPSDPKQKEMGDKAEVQALEWFGKWLA
jgi:dienelactone hydrolase